MRGLFFFLVFGFAFTFTASAAALPVRYPDGNLAFEIPTAVCAEFPANLPGIGACPNAPPFDEAAANAAIHTHEPGTFVRGLFHFRSPTATLIVTEHPQKPGVPLTGPWIIEIGTAMERALRMYAPPGTKVSSARNMLVPTRGLQVVRFSIDATPPPEAAASWEGARQVRYVVSTSEGVYNLTFVTDLAHVDTLDALALTVASSLQGTPTRDRTAYFIGFAMGRYGLVIIVAVVVLVAFLVRRYRRKVGHAPRVKA